MIMEIKSSHLENDSFKVYLEDLCSALEEVSPEYKKWILYNTDASGEVKETQESYCERVFAYELYHQLRLIMEPCRGHVEERYRELILNGEQVKLDNFYKHLFEGLSKLSEKFKKEGENKIIPDLVLHKNIGTIDKDGQIYLVEIKMGENTNELDDLEKLTLLTKSELYFHFYIFVYVDKSIDELKEMILHKGVDVFSKNIVCICLESNNAICTTLGELTEH